MKKLDRYNEINSELGLLRRQINDIHVKFNGEFKALKSQIWKESVQSGNAPNWKIANDFEKNFYKNTPELDCLRKKTDDLLAESKSLEDEVYTWKLKNGWKLEKPCNHCSGVIMIFWNKQLNIWTLEDTITPYYSKLHVCPFKKYLKKDKI